MAYEKYTINQFKEAWFSNDRTVMNDEEFEIVYSEYVDTSGLFISEIFDLQSIIMSISQRIDYIKMFIRMQRDFIESFKIPYERAFKTIKDKYGHVLKWKNDRFDFEMQLKNIESREVKQTSYLEAKKKELESVKKQQGKLPQDNDINKQRKGFIITVNSLGKVGFKIDSDKTTVEEFALMIKQQTDEQDEIRNSRNNRYGR